MYWIRRAKPSGQILSNEMSPLQWSLQPARICNARTDWDQQFYHEGRSPCLRPLINRSSKLAERQLFLCLIRQEEKWPPDSAWILPRVFFLHFFYYFPDDLSEAAFTHSVLYSIKCYTNKGQLTFNTKQL